MPFNDVFNFLDDVYKGVKSDFSKVISPVKTDIINVEKSIPSDFHFIGSDITKVINPVKTTISGLERAMSGGVHTVGTDISNIEKSISSDIHSVGSGIEKAINPVYHTITGAISDISSILSKPIVELPQAIKSDISGLTSLFTPPNSNSSPSNNQPFSLTDFLKKYGLWIGVGVAILIVVVLIARK